MDYDNEHPTVYDELYVRLLRVIQFHLIVYRSQCHRRVCPSPIGVPPGPQPIHNEFVASVTAISRTMEKRAIRIAFTPSRSHGGCLFAILHSSGGRTPHWIVFWMRRLFYFQAYFRRAIWQRGFPTEVYPIGTRKLLAGELGSVPLEDSSAATCRGRTLYLLVGESSGEFLDTCPRAAKQTHTSGCPFAPLHSRCFLPFCILLARATSARSTSVL